MNGEPDAPPRVAPSLVLLGNLLVDDVVFPDGRTRMAQPGGAILYGSLAASLWGVSAGCVSLRGGDYPPAALAELAARGVLLEGVHDLEANGLRTWLLYEGAVRRVLHRQGGPSHEAVSPEPRHVPVAWRCARAFHVAPMPLATQRTLVGAIRDWELEGSPAFVSLDPHVPVTPESLGEWRELLRQVDAFCPSEDEVRWPEGAGDPLAALAGLAGGRLRYVLWKRGAAGGALYDAREDRWLPWEPLERRVEDPTGAGDAFTAGFVTALLEGAAPEAALRRARVTASFAMEEWGPDGLLAATRAEAEARLAADDRPARATAGR